MSLLIVEHVSVTIHASARLPWQARLRERHRQAAAQNVVQSSPQSNMQSEDSTLEASESGDTTSGQTKEERLTKAESATVQSLQPCSNVTSRSCPDMAKQTLEMTSIDAGKQIDQSHPHPSNAESWRVETRDPASNVTSESRRQPWKHAVAIVSTEDGMQIAESCLFSAR
jgi:hypothetical protein